MNQKTKPFLVQLNSFTAKPSPEQKLEVLSKRFAELELRVSRLERENERLKQERKQ